MVAVPVVLFERSPVTLVGIMITVFLFVVVGIILPLQVCFGFGYVSSGIVKAFFVYPVVVLTVFFLVVFLLWSDACSRWFFESVGPV